MVDKRREQQYVEHLRRALPSFPAGAIEQCDRTCEPPDFVVHVDGGGRVGIEVTVFHPPAEPGERPEQELQSLKEWIAAMAMQYHAQAGGPPLYVDVFFDDPARITKRNARALASQLANSVLAAQVPKVLGEFTVRLPIDALPKAIGDVRIDAAAGDDRLWTADQGGWVATAEPHQIESIVTRKAARVPAAMVRCDDLWLVIVNDVFSRARAAEIGRDALLYRYSHPFGRLLWFEVHRERAFDLLSLEGQAGGRTQ